MPGQAAQGGCWCPLPADGSAFSPHLKPWCQPSLLSGTEQLLTDFLLVFDGYGGIVKAFTNRVLLFNHFFKVKAASQQTCWMSHLTGLWVTDLSSPVRPHGKWGGRDPPSHSDCVGKGCANIDWEAKISACPLTFCQSKPRADVLWAAAVISLRSLLKNWTRSFLEDLASSVKP